MKKRKLTLKRETVRKISSKSVVGGYANQSIQSGETYCWCTDGCNVERFDAR